MIVPIILGMILIFIGVMVTRALLRNGEDELAVIHALSFAIMLFLIVLFVIGARQRQDDSRFERIEEPVYRLKQ